MSPGRHALVSVALSSGTFAVTRDIPAAAAVFLGGTAIDLDHLFDFFLNRGGRFTPNRFVRVCEQFRLGKFFLFLHSLEWIIPFVVLAFALPLPLWVRGLAVGLGVHMALDLRGNGMHPWAYFLSFRIAKRFNSRACVDRLPRSGMEYWGSMRAYRRGIPDKSRWKGNLDRKNNWW